MDGIWNYGWGVWNEINKWVVSVGQFEIFCFFYILLNTTICKFQGKQSAATQKAAAVTFTPRDMTFTSRTRTERPVDDFDLDFNDDLGDSGSMDGMETEDNGFDVSQDDADSQDSDTFCTDDASGK